MPSLKEIAAAASLQRPNHSILLYGPPKTGKTGLVATAAELPEINKIYWFDLENGIETILHKGYSDEILDKIQVFKIANTRDNPIAIETLLKVFSAKSPIQICDLHGRVDCVVCKGNKDSFTPFYLGQAGHNDLVVIDSGSELGDSALAATLKGKDPLFKPGWDEYALVGKWLGDILSVIQQSFNTNFVVITHEISLEDDQKKERIFPLMGSKAFSMKCGKYFGTVVYTEIKLGKHVAGSSSTYKSNVITGSRVNAVLEKAAVPTMKQILIDGGILSRKGG